MIPLEEALRRLDAAVSDRRLPAEKVSLEQARGRFLASDVASRLDLPPFDKSAVDGYALLEGDYNRKHYQLLETVAAGRPGKAELKPGTTVKVMTGAPLPAGTGRVLMLEDTDEQGVSVEVRKPPKDANLCRRGEDVQAGQVIFTKGQRLGPLEIANLVGCGVTEVETVTKPRLFVISTGDEIVDRPEDLQPGKIMNSNGPLLAGLAQKHGLAVLGCVSVPDDPAELERVLASAVREADIVILSGGVSAGEYDFVPEVIQRLGLTIHFSRLAVKPGKPTTFATGPEAILFGLPGNPVAVYLMFHLMVLRVIANLSGAPAAELRFSAPLAREFRRASTVRKEYVPARITPDGAVERVEYHGSAHLTALMQADGFFEVPLGVGEIKAGARVPFFLLG
ncbi:MAG: molybdopterin molybdenumtransferase MoeA [Acidobacteria bacterium]|nr:MAG: molybdopterin molybdenumtransferase MoeA [Acidobacteriota bacterium]